MQEGYNLKRRNFLNPRTGTLHSGSTYVRYVLSSVGTCLIPTLLTAPPHHVESLDQGLDMHYLIAKSDSVPRFLTMLLTLKTGKS
ncbi:hypothetical protein J6590_044885 [Homalodisca vitripennis]|nr:hypothetical protein J6590_044885 [Homalodisca vitripennis]